MGERLCEEVHYCCGWPYSGMAASVPTKGPQLSLRLAPLASWKRETWHKKVLLALPMKSSFLSRGTTLQLPDTQMMLYPPTIPTPSASLGGCECLGPHQHAILQGRACARWLISTEDTLPPFLLLSLMLFSSSSYLLQVHFIYHSFLDGAPCFLLKTCPDILYTIQAAHPEGSDLHGKIKSGDPVEELFVAGEATRRSRGLDPWMNGCPSVWRSNGLVKHLHGPLWYNEVGFFLILVGSGKEIWEW